MSFYVRKQKKNTENWKDQSQPLRAKVNSLLMVVNALIRGDMPLHFKYGAPQGNIPSAELRMKPISKKITGLWYLCFCKQNAESTFGITF